MKVLFLTNIPTPYRVDFFNELGKHCELTVLYERKHASDRDKSWVGDKDRCYRGIYLKGTNITADSALCLEVKKWLNKKLFDVFIVGGYSTPTGMLAIQIMKNRKIPFILNSDGGFIKEDRKIIYLIKRYFISSAKWWLSTGKMSNKYLEYYGADKDNIFIYPFSSIKEKDIIQNPLGIGEKNSIRQELGLEGKKIAVSVGQFIHRKGYDLLIEAWKKIDKEWTLLIIGSGEEKTKLDNLIKTNNLENVRLIAFQQKEQLKKYYLAADLFILPTREDIWGLVINEAMGCGLPIITTNKCIAGIEMVENNKNGVIISVEDINNIENIVKEVCYLNADNNLNYNNINQAKKYCIENMVREHLKIFDQIYKEI